MNPPSPATPQPGAFYRHILACNGFDGSGFLPLSLEGVPIGWLSEGFARQLRNWPQRFHLHDQREMRLTFTTSDFAQRTQAFSQLLHELLQQGLISRLHDEQFPVIRQHQPAFLINRAAVAYFGIRAFGQHLNGYVRRGDQLLLWIARRAQDRVNYPGHLDNLVAGGLPWGIGLEANLRKECHEEASIPPELACRARPVGSISYFALSEKGAKPDTLYCYDLELPADFIPRCNDGEVESFQLVPAAEVLEWVASSDEFKLNCNLVIIDFAIRHGLITPDHPEYLPLTQGLHRPLAATPWKADPAG